MRIFLLLFCSLFLLLHSEDAIVSTERPAHFNPSFEVAGCYCEHKDKVLFLLRNEKKPQGNRWCVPGGKLEKGETARHALARELQEEIGWSCAEDSFIYCKSVYVQFPEVAFILHLFRKTFDSSPPPPLTLAQTEHTDYRWVSKKEIEELPLIPGGKKCFDLVERTRCNKNLPF